jgi:hypothetical protein
VSACKPSGFQAKNAKRNVIFHAFSEQQKGKRKIAETGACCKIDTSQNRL